MTRFDNAIVNVCIFNLVVVTPLVRLSHVHAASRTCDLTGKKANNGYVVTFSHKRIHKLQDANLQHKKVWWPEQQRWVKLRLSTKVRQAQC